MDTTKIIEAIKTMNIKFDGSPNSETVERVVSILAPYFKYYLIYQAVMTIIGYAVLIVCVYLISKSTMTYWKSKE